MSNLSSSGGPTPKSAPQDLARHCDEINDFNPKNDSFLLQIAKLVVAMFLVGLPSCATSVEQLPGAKEHLSCVLTLLAPPRPHFPPRRASLWIQWIQHHPVAPCAR